MLSAKYHLEELKIALDPSHPAHILPPRVSLGSRVLDLGCGAGQTLIAAYPHHTTHGLDIDLPILQLGQTLSGDVRFCCGRAEALPYREDAFDIVVARVSLAYTDIGQTLQEIRRVLKPGGRLWITLHTWHTPWETAKRGNWRGKLFFSYIVANSLLFHLTQKQFCFLGRYESFQTQGGMLRALRSSGFEDLEVSRSRHFLIQARSSKAAMTVGVLVAAQ